MSLGVVVPILSFEKMYELGVNFNERLVMHNL